MSIINIARSQTLRLMVNVFPSQCLLPTNIAMPCTLSRKVASHLIGPVIAKLEQFLTNYEAPPCKKWKVAETKSTTKQESSKIYESTQRKRTLNPLWTLWKESFPWLEYHVVTKEGKMICFVCKRYDRSRYFCVGSTKSKCEAIEAHTRSDCHKQNQMCFDTTMNWSLTASWKIKKTRPTRCRNQCLNNLRWPCSSN